VILSSSKYYPSIVMHLCQRLIQLSKHFWNSIVGIAIRAVFDFFITSFREVTLFPVMVFWLDRTEKNAGSIRWIRWLLDDIRFVLDQKFTIMMALCDGALSWCKIHELFAHKSKLENTSRGRCTQDGVTFTNVKLWW